jgi:MoaA/NifB/PqqE/SkfB family radical SAM enzyme
VSVGTGGVPTASGRRDRIGMISARRSIALFGRAVRSLALGGPLCASFEITRRCNARCRHCHLGIPVEEEIQASPARFAEICRELKPVAILVSGGEPLLREDVEDVVAALADSLGPPYVAMTTNGWLLDRGRYETFRRLGVDRFSISLDFPDERHDEFRKLPGLFRRIESLVADLGTDFDKAINLSCVVHKLNFRDMVRFAELGREWGVRLNFSTYTTMRTGEEELLLSDGEVAELREIVREIISLKRVNKNIRTSDYVLRRIVRFFEKGGIGNCRAGDRFLVVNPDGTLSPCGLIITAYRTREELIGNFTRNNTCSACYTSSRADSERPLRYLLSDTMDFQD